LLINIYNKMIGYNWYLYCDGPLLKRHTRLLK